jgi:hypothetical protein
MLYKSPNVRTVELSWVWNGEKKTEVIPVTPGNEEYYVTSTILSDMDEGSYTFAVKAIDIHGNSSLEVTGFANSYDSIVFKSTLSNRYANGIGNHNGKGMTINWANAPASIEWTEIRYKTMDNKEETLILSPDQSSILCPGGKLTDRFEYRSVYLPEENALDTVYKEWIVSEEYPRTSLWLSGNGTPAEWDANRQIEMPFDESNPWVYTCEVDLDSNGGEIKILTAKGDWNGNTFRPLVANGSISETTMQVYPGGTDLKWKVVGGEDGRYKITLDLNKMEAHFEKLVSDVPEEVDVEELFNNVKAYWQFDDPSDITKASMGSPLIRHGAGFTVVEGPKAGDGAVRVAKESYFRAPHGIAANGGGSRVNNFSVMFDFKVSELGRYYSFIQTTLENNDDAEFFIRPAGNLGINGTGYSEQAATAGKWHRLVISASMGNAYLYYLDGTLIHTGNIGSATVDSRWSWLPEGVLLFADEDGEDNDIDIANIAVWDRALSESEANALGGVE